MNTHPQLMYTTENHPYYQGNGWPTQAMKDHPYYAEFERINNHKKSAAMLIEMTLKPEKFKEFHEYLNFVHEEWLKYIGEKK